MDINDVTTHEHESYATISISRAAHGNARPLFGSNLKHGNSIYLRLNHAKKERQLSSDWIFSTKCIAEVEMSYSQFAELITSLNQGEGVPCTLRYLNGKSIEPPPAVDGTQIRKQEFAKDQQEIKNKAADALKKAKDLLDKKSVTMADRKEIVSMLESLCQELGPNTDFKLKCFDEYAAKTLTEAKSEVEAFVQNKLIAIGNQALVENGDSLKLDAKNTVFIESPDTTE